MILAPSDAPPWAHDFARSVERAIGDQSWPFISRKVYLTTELTAALAVQNPFKFARLSNGAGNKNLAISDGIVFRYADGGAV